MYLVIKDTILYFLWPRCMSIWQHEFLSTRAVIWTHSHWEGFRIKVHWMAQGVSAALNLVYLFWICIWQLVSKAYPIWYAVKYIRCLFHHFTATATATTTATATCRWCSTLCINHLISVVSFVVAQSGTWKEIMVIYQLHSFAQLIRVMLRVSNVLNQYNDDIIWDTI